MRARRPAPDRSGQAGSDRPARNRRHWPRSRTRFILFCDDLSFNADEPGYKALKAVLDGSVAATPENVLHLCHIEPAPPDAGISCGRTWRPSTSATRSIRARRVEEKISLSERFGLWVSFYPFDQDEYLDDRAHWLAALRRARGRRRGDAPRGAAVGAAARLAQRPRRLAVRARLGRPARHRPRAACSARSSSLSADRRRAAVSKSSRR